MTYFESFFIDSFIDHLLLFFCLFRNSYFPKKLYTTASNCLNVQHESQSHALRGSPHQRAQEQATATGGRCQAQSGRKHTGSEALPTVYVEHTALAIQEGAHAATHAHRAATDQVLRGCHDPAVGRRVAYQIPTNWTAACQQQQQQLR